MSRLHCVTNPCRTRLASLSANALALVLCCSCASTPELWWKGNLHTHSLWSDGDEFPEVIAAWYKDNGYQFLAISDHNVMHEGEFWVTVASQSGLADTLARYETRFGSDWVESRRVGQDVQVRLMTLPEYRPLFEEPGRFLLIPAEEITNRFEDKRVHVNATNLVALIPAQEGVSVLDVMQKSVDAVQAQRARTGQPMFPHVNHPNFFATITAEDLIALHGDRFFEVYNGDPGSHNEGLDDRPSTERLWDLVLTERLRLGREILFGLATDDAHEYQHTGTDKKNPGRGWVMVRSARLSPDAIVAAMEAGNFYSSTGVRLRDIMYDGHELRIRIDAEQGVEYTTYFIGTRRDDSEAGRVLAAQKGISPAYSLVGDEIYVRATVTSSKLKQNPYPIGDEYERAWTQPVLPQP